MILSYGDTPNRQPVPNGAANLEIVDNFLSRFRTTVEIDWLENAIGLAKRMLAENSSPGVMELVLPVMFSLFQIRSEVIQIPEDPGKDVCRASNPPPMVKELVNQVMLAFDLKLSDARSTHEQSIQRREGLSPNSKQVHRLIGIATSSLEKFYRLGTVEDLWRAIQWTKDSIAATSANDTIIRPMQLLRLSSMNLSMWERFGAPADLHQSIKLDEEVLEMFPPYHPLQIVVFNSLVSNLGHRYHLSAIKLNAEGVSLTAPESPQYVDLLSSLSITLRAKPERPGSVDDVEQLIKLSEEVVERNPAGVPSRPSALPFLSNSILNRFDHFGGLEDIERRSYMRRRHLH
ncbi:hypothetical protein Q9L58_006769 [Maublancomyces gigas]|uniref:Uncharacterized protein n=1 Tax=Discina gigas TaxID=1032678 RepID=A0ABR3GED7_9PEZI